MNAMLDMAKHYFSVRGHSDFQVVRMPSGDIQKLAHSHNMQRLRAQCEKQKNFTVENSKFIICPVLNEFEMDGSYGFTMPFCRGEVAPEFVDRASPNKIRTFIQQLIALVENFVVNSEVRSVDASQILNKSLSVKEAVQQNPLSPQVLTDLIDGHIESIKTQKTFELPIGKCHGDLTLSNIIFDDANDRYFLIDFLDSYLESPILDLAKISQETQLLWTSKLMSQTHDSTKYKIAMAAIDEEVQKHFSKYEWYKNYQSIFEFQNLIRVLPYARDQDIIQAIIDRLRALIKS
ncbi:phosphotransferase [Polynucleobacter sp. AP-Feld-500C-C5]|uniref:phosphotransferase n=1 Tax=Polynucleobacter sp. AP-Feld-500C-C5 TaxID=2576924 RepID=UPI001C0ABD4A|nr:phosphotransferase [Polynucleobacter sp. AP-Feld-500C-C5]MBU3632840.1 phosphotransferase [Polynucleobacter sp. AP-Feld-500C-C5]